MANVIDSETLCTICLEKINLSLYCCDTTNNLTYGINGLLPIEQKIIDEQWSVNSVINPLNILDQIPSPPSHSPSEQELKEQYQNNRSNRLENSDSTPPPSPVYQNFFLPIPAQPNNPVTLRISSLSNRVLSSRQRYQHASMPPPPPPPPPAPPPNNSSIASLTLSNIAGLKVVSEKKSDISDEIKILQCGHIFHTACINRWLESNRTCPVCRNIELTDETKSESSDTLVAVRTGALKSLLIMGVIMLSLIFTIMFIMFMNY